MGRYLRYHYHKIKKGKLYSISNFVNRRAQVRDEEWQVDTARKHGLMYTLNERGRPRKMCKGDLGYDIICKMHIEILDDAVEVK